MIFSYIVLIVVEGKIVVYLEVVEVEYNIEVLKVVLIVYVVGENTIFLYMENYVYRNWNKVVSFFIFMYEEGFFMVKFYI